MPGVVSVQPRVQGGLLSQVLQGVQIARDVYGIKHEGDMADLAQAKDAREQEAFDQQQEGVQPASQKVMALRYGDSVPEGTPGSVKMKFQGDETPTFVQPFKDKPQSSPLKDYANAMINGKHGTATYDPTQMKMGDPAAGLVGFVETAKEQAPVKEPNPHYQMQTDAAGNAYKFNTLTGEAVPIQGTEGTAFGKNAPNSQKDADKAEKVYTELGKAVETPRGNKAVQTAMTNQLSVQNALSLANKYKTNYDAMTPNDYNLFVGELSKISTGGIGSQHSQEALTANTVESNWQAFKQKIGGNPTPAQLGEFIKGNVEYLNDLNKISTTTVNNYKMQIYNSYKHRLPPELQQRFQAEHGDLFGGQQQPAAAVAATVGSAHGQGGIESTATAAQGAPVAPNAALHPAAQTATQWAMSHLKDPDAATAAKAKAILQRINQGAEQTQDKGVIDTVKGWFQ